MKPQMTDVGNVSRFILKEPHGSVNGMRSGYASRCSSAHGAVYLALCGLKRKDAGCAPALVKAERSFWQIHAGVYGRR